MLRVAGAKCQTRCSMLYQLSQTTDVAADANLAQRHRLKRLQWRDSLCDHSPNPRIDKHVHDRVPRRHLGVRHVARKNHSGKSKLAHLCFECAPLGSVADNDEANTLALR